VLVPVIPLFPLGTVLFPGVALPLHIFEPRYRQLVDDLQHGEDDQERSFGVVSIRAGHEVGSASVSALHEVGTSAVLRRVTPYPDGRFDILTSGARRFRLRGVDDALPYLRGEVEWLDEQLGPAQQAGALALAVGQRFRGYQQQLGADPDESATLPADPTVLSYLVSAAMVLDATDRQRLLAVPTTTERLDWLLRVLAREQGLLRALDAVPATDLLRGPVSVN
jgi:hypothetical protein